jgi:uncharacterized protein YerC
MKEMAKFHRHNRLPTEEREEYFIQLCFVLSRAKNIMEAANILKDLLTEQEVEMISKRLQIADLLIDGSSYSEIKRVLKTSDSTIARVHEWLKLAGDGFRLAKEKLKAYEHQEKRKASMEKSSWGGIKRKYPIYFWPQIILEEVIKNSNKTQKARIKQVLNQVKQKSELSKRISLLLKE